MTEADYDSEGAAQALVDTQCSTLGITRSRLGKMLRHLAYDGVYATTEQRTGGGGSLNLTKFVARELGLKEGSIAGTWDFSHIFQVIWNTWLKKNPRAMAVIGIYFKAMGEWRIGKQASMFKKFAQELGCLVLSNKTYQETRFVASLMRGLTAVTTNLPTLIALYAEAYNKAALECNNTKSKEVQKTLKELMNPKNLIGVTALQQLLEKYTKLSLTAQSSTNPPPVVWALVIEVQEELRKLASSWEWGKEDLKMSGTEAPCKVVQRLLDDRIYRPKMVKANVRLYKDLEEAELLEEGEKIEDLFIDDEPVRPLCGQTLMDNLDQ
jgi:hypothetical protein